MIHGGAHFVTEKQKGRKDSGAEMIYIIQICQRHIDGFMPGRHYMEMKQVVIIRVGNIGIEFLAFDVRFDVVKYLLVGSLFLFACRTVLAAETCYLVTFFNQVA